MDENKHEQPYLYHYTDKKGLLGIIKNRSIWASHILFQNDMNELIYGKGIFYNYIRDNFAKIFINYSNTLVDDVEGWISFFNNPVFTISFSEDKASLNQFRSYAKTKSGFSIGFNVNKIRESFNGTNTRCRLKKCIYSLDDQYKFVEKIIEECIKEKCIGNKLNDDFVSYLAAHIVSNSTVIKHSSFSEEKEWRLIFDYLNPIRDKYHFREGESFIVPYLEINIKLEDVLGEIIIGPTPHDELAVYAVRELLGSLKLFDSEIEKKIYYSDLPYRNW